MENICPNCKVKFVPKKYNVARGGGKYCSAECYRKGPKVINQKGSKSPFWKGGKAKYGSIHDLIKARFGSAVRCESPKCVYPRRTKNGMLLLKPKVFDWALKRGRKYTDRKIDSFIQLCRSCHQQYDFKEKMRQRNERGIFISNKSKRKSRFWDRI